MSVKSGRHAPASLTFFRDGIARKRDLQAFEGVDVHEGIQADGTVTQAIFLGPMHDGNVKGANTIAIPLSSDPQRAPRIAGAGRVFHAHVGVDHEDCFELVAGQKEGVHTRVFSTGLNRPKFVSHRGALLGFRQRALSELRVAGLKVGYHGVFALEKGSAHIVTEGGTVEVLEAAQVFELTEDNARKLKGVGIPESREILAEVPIGGAILCGDFTGLTVHERRKEGWKVYDLTGDPSMMKIFQAYAENDLKQRAEARQKIEAAAQAQE